MQMSFLVAVHIFVGSAFVDSLFIRVAPIVLLGFVYGPCLFASQRHMTVNIFDFSLWWGGLICSV